MLTGINKVMVGCGDGTGEPEEPRAGIARCLLDVNITSKLRLVGTQR